MITEGSYSTVNCISNPAVPLSHLARQLRSAIITPDGKIISISPAKSVPFDEFSARSPIQQHLCDADYIQISEFVEGTMVNLAHDGDNWILSTKTNCGANTRFYMDPIDPTFNSYRTMFMDALGVDHADLRSEWAFQNHPYLLELPTNWTYSFVLQHPANQMCFAITDPRLYLVAVYQMDDDQITSIPQKTFMSDHRLSSHTSVHFPQMDTTMLSDLVMCARIISPDIDVDRVWEFVLDDTQGKDICASSIGVVITNFDTGDRTKIINSKFIHMSQMRGHHPNMFVQYLDVVHNQGRVNDYLSVFPQFTAMFDVYSQIVAHYVQTAYRAYVGYHCYFPREPAPKNLIRVIHELHNELYMTTLRPFGHSMSSYSVKSYLETMPVLALYNNVIIHHKLMTGQIQQKVVGDENV